ncbi:tc5 transposase DNA-binding domain-containing protein [Ditylenchus destructor]|nr:tc5 transposase DNA-binding domain-containing protein [Ditylenchus destructor]
MRWWSWMHRSVYGHEGCQAKRSRIYPAKHTELENAIVSWLKSARSQNIALSGPLIKGKAKEFAELLHIKNFEASDGWLARLKQRHSISLNSEQSEAGMNLDDIPNKLRKCAPEPSSNGPENVPECSNSRPVRVNLDEICTETNDVMATWRKQLCIKEEPVLEASEGNNFDLELTVTYDGRRRHKL